MSTTEEKIKVMQAFIEGKPIESKPYRSKHWGLNNDPIWCWWSMEYRVRVEKPSINWDHVSPKYKYLVSTGQRAYLSVDKPRLSDDRFRWTWAGGDISTAHVFTSYRPGNCEWQDSLVERP